jgi:hypothetical protein
MRSWRSRDVSSKRLSSSSDFGLRLFLFFSIVLEQTPSFDDLAVDVEKHSEDSIDIRTLNELRLAPGPHAASVRRASPSRKMACEAGAACLAPRGVPMTHPRRRLGLARPQQSPALGAEHAHELRPTAVLHADALDLGRELAWPAPRRERLVDFPQQLDGFLVGADLRARKRLID